jgi:uncharacterized protein
MTRRQRIAVSILGSAALIAATVTGVVIPTGGAWILLHPIRRADAGPPPAGCETTRFAGAGVTLVGWQCSTAAPRRGSVVYLHGVADNRRSARSVINRFLPRGFDVVAYDSRANGESTGEACTYGFYEKQDLQGVISSLAPGPVVLVGGSLGAAVALQAAAGHPRVSAVVAVETFSDLRTIATERAPSFFSNGAIRRGLALAEWLGRFTVDDVSPVRAAASLTIPVLVVHGDADTDTPTAHSRRVAAALAGPKRLLLVPGAGHNQSLRADVWGEIEAWIDQYVPGGGA